jgi:hypothetical protein
MADRDEHDEYLDDDKDLPLEQDLREDADEPAEAVCPSCRSFVSEEAQKCPFCGDWITPAQASQYGWRRWLFIAAVLVMLWALLRWMRLL